MDETGGVGAPEAAALRRAADAIVLPAPLLEGWSSVCAEEYAAAVARLAGHLATLRRVLAALP